jgi:SAM-dependent methyltransferase
MSEAKARKFYRDFWKNKESPLHRENDEKSYELYAEEINLVLKHLGYRGGKVLEVGCGNGALYPFLNIPSENYLGVDISPKMIEIFQSEHPEANVSVADGGDLSQFGDVDVIFGNAVHQHFPPKMLAANIEQAQKMLGDGGIFLMANVPYRRLRSQYYGGALADSHREEKVSAKEHLRRFWHRYIKVHLPIHDHIGFWYDVADIKQLRQEGTSLSVYGSIFYPYRVHFAMKVGGSDG